MCMYPLRCDLEADSDRVNCTTHVLRAVSLRLSHARNRRQGDLRRTRVLLFVKGAHQANLGRMRDWNRLCVRDLALAENSRVCISQNVPCAKMEGIRNLHRKFVFAVLKGRRQFKALLNASVTRDSLQTDRSRGRTKSARFVRKVRTALSP